jgi:hypothetical protein
MFITAHQGASPYARHDEVPNHIAVAIAAALIVNFARVFATTMIARGHLAGGSRESFFAASSPR